MLFYILIKVMLIYQAFSLALPFRISRLRKLLVLLLLLFFSLQPFNIMFMRFMKEGWSMRDFALLFDFFSFSYIVCILMVPMTCLKDAVFLIRCAFRRRGKATPWPHAGIVALIVFIGVCGATIGCICAAAPPEVRTVELRIRDLPEEFDGFVIVQISDLHTNVLRGPEYAAEVARLANEANPDMIVLTGDQVDGTVDSCREILAPLKDLSAPCGVYAIAGNHEYVPSKQNWRDLFESFGIVWLENETVPIRRKPGGATIWLSGLPDDRSVKGGADGELADLELALRGREPMKECVVLLNHRPLNCKEAAASGVDLQFSGHTHGGAVLGMGLLAALFNEGHLSGRFDIDGMELFVSNGIGMWPGLPFRLGVSSEIVRAVLRCARK